MTPEDIAAEMAEFDALMAAADAERAALTAALEAGRRMFAHHHRAGWHALVTPSTRPDCPPGAWQVTRLDADGPQGHRYGSRWAGVVEALRDDGYTEPM